MSYFPHVLWCINRLKWGFWKDSLCVGNVDNELNGNVKLSRAAFKVLWEFIIRVGSIDRRRNGWTKPGAPVLHRSWYWHLHQSCWHCRFTSSPASGISLQLGVSGSPHLLPVVKAYEHNLDDDIKHFTASNMIWGLLAHQLEQRNRRKKYGWKAAILWTRPLCVYNATFKLSSSWAYIK